jgi:hypothetical protein
VDSVWLDILPETTRQIAEWEQQFGLSTPLPTDAERRDRLDARWKLKGGQGPGYIEAQLQSNGFDVYVHEWWDPADKPPPGVKSCVAPRDPRLYLRGAEQTLDTRAQCGEDFMHCGEPEAQCANVVFSLIAQGFAQCGEPLMQCGEFAAQCGNIIFQDPPLGYPLVNIIYRSRKADVAQCGETFMHCGEPLAQCGNFLRFALDRIEYAIPNDPTKWHFFLYLGAETFPERAQVPLSRRDEFEALCLQMAPAQQWLGMLIEYV